MFRFSVRSNPLILWGIAVELTLLGLLVYTPFGNYILGTAPLPLWAWIPLAFGPAVLLLAEEGRKRILAKLRRYNSDSAV